MNESDKETENKEYTGRTTMKEDTKERAKKEVATECTTMKEGTMEEIATMAELEKQQAELATGCVQIQTGVAAEAFFNYV